MGSRPLHATHRRVRIVAIASALAMLLPLAPALGHGVVEQAHTGDDGTRACSTAQYPGSKTVTSSESRQSFKPVRSRLTSIEVCVQDFVGGPGDDLRVQLYRETEGGNLETVGPSENRNVPSQLSPQWLHIDIPRVTTPGVTYVIGLTPIGLPTSAVSFKWRATCNNSLTTSCNGVTDAYPDGNTSDLPANSDYAFRSFYEPSQLEGNVTVDPLVCPGLPLDENDRASGSVTNNGSAVGPFRTEWWLSPDPVVDGTDAPLGGEVINGLAAGATATLTPPSPVPANAPQGPAYLLLNIDPDRATGPAGGLAAGETLVIPCAEPEVVDLALTVDEPDVSTAFRDITAADLPLQDLAVGLPQTFAEAESNLEASPYGFSPVGFSPLGFSPLGFSPVGFSPVGFSPYGFSPYGFSPLGFSPYGFSPLGFSPVGFSPLGFSSLAAILNDLPPGLLDKIMVVDVPITGAPWLERLREALQTSDIRPIQDWTLGEAIAALDGTDYDVTAYEVDLRAILRAGWLALALAGGTMNDLPVPDGYLDQCDWLAAVNFDCVAVGFDPATQSLLAAQALGAPVHAIPTAGATLDLVTLNPNWLVRDIKLGGTPGADVPRDRAHVELTRLGGLAADAALVSPTSILDCGGVFDCSRPLAEAVAVGGFLPNKTVGDLLDGLSPAGLQTATVSDLAMLVADFSSIDFGDMLWTLVDPAKVNPGCDTVTYHITGDVQAASGGGQAAAVSPTISSTLTRGFGYAPGTVQLTANGTVVPQAEPTVSRDAEGRRTLTFQTEGLISGPFDLSFEACASLYIGHQVIGTAASVTGTHIDDVAYETLIDSAGISDTVKVLELTEEEGPTDRPDTAQLVGANAVVALSLQSADDVDHVKIALPADPDSLTIVRVFSPPTVDVDMFAHGPAISPFAFSPVGFSPVGFSPLGFSPLGFSPYGFSPLGFSPYGFSNDGAPINGTEEAAEPDTLGDVPTHLAPSDTSGLRGISARRGDQVETLYLRNHEGDEGYFTIGISGYNGTQSNAPVIVTTQQISPTPNEDLASCAPAPWPAPVGPATATAPTWNGTGTPRTVFVTNREASIATHGLTEATAGLNAITGLAARPDVRGIVLEVDHNQDVRDAYAAWHGNWCSPTAANLAAQQIRGQILTLRHQYPTIDSIVMVGGDELLPDFRLVDTSLLANESQYTQSLLNTYGQNNPVVAAYAHGTIPSLDPYGTKQPIVYGQTHAFLPDAGISRLVETPADWQTQVNAFTTGNGLLNPQDGLVSGYDGMTDGAAAARDALVQAGVTPTQLLTSPTWSGADFRAGRNANPGNGEIVNMVGFNAHANHWAILSALGSGEGTNDIVLADEEAGRPANERGVMFSNGCHAGTQAPDALFNGSPDAGQAQRLVDWNQSIASRGGIAVTNSGFGIFDTELVGYGEHLQQLFIERLATAPNAGLALAQAKSAYMSSLSLHDSYTYKTVQQLGMFGLGILKMPGASDTVPPTPPANSPSIPVTTGDLGFAPVTTGNGTVHNATGTPTNAVDTTPIAVNGRPIVPKLTMAVPLPAGRASAGFWITDVDSTHVTNANPAIARAGVSRADRHSESQTRSSIFPTNPASVLDLGGTAYVTLPLGMYSTNGKNGAAHGTLRLDKRVDGELLLRNVSTAPTAGLPPSITEVTSVQPTNTNLFVIDVLAHDTTVDGQTIPNIRAAALAQDDLGEWHYVELQKGTNGHWTGGFRLSAGAVRVVGLLAEVFNGQAVTYYREKGEPPKPNHTVSDGVSLNLSLATTGGAQANGVWTGAVQATIIGDDGVVYTVRDGDHAIPGQFSNGDSFTISGDGVHQVNVVGSDESSTTEWIIIDSTPPVVTITTPPNGASYTINAAVTVKFSCADAGAGSSCTATVDGTPITSGAALPTGVGGSHTFRVTAIDETGSTTVETHTYSVVAFTMSPFDSPIDPKPALNRVNRSSSVPVKFTAYDKDTGTERMNPAIIQSATWTRIDCTTKAPTGAPPTNAMGGGAEYHNGHFHIEATAPSTKGCYELKVTLTDGTSQTAWFDVK